MSSAWTPDMITSRVVIILGAARANRARVKLYGSESLRLIQQRSFPDNF
jgi:hypothetical protein